MIIHYMLFVNGNKRYLCNQACGTTKKKMSKDWNKIDCENCLKQRDKWDTQEHKSETKEKIE